MKSMKIKFSEKFINEEEIVLNSILKNEFGKTNYGSFPSSAVLLFRRYYLDMDIDERTREQFQNWLKDVSLWESLDDDIFYGKNIAMYKSLVFYSKNNKMIEKLSNLFEAIKRPVLSIEDRLLNYQATKLALETIGSCIDPTDLSSDGDNCNEFKEYQNSNTGTESIIISKLVILYNLQNMQNRNLIKDLETQLMMDNHIIEQDVLHLIVTAAINVDIKSEIYNKNIENVKLAIQSLNNYVKVQQKILNNENKPEIIDTGKTIPETDQVEKKTIEMKYDKEFTTKYSLEDRINNLFIAYKWLIELNGLLCDSSQSKNELLKTQNNIKNLASVQKKLFGTENISTDDHFMYLKAKLKCQILLTPNVWEATIKPDGWSMLSSTKQLESINLLNAKEQEMLTQLIYLQNNSKCPYINRIEICTIIFRFFWQLNVDYVAMYTYIKSAITEIVVTPEDRLRNFEAHELFTMYLMERNDIGVKMTNELNINQIYNTFMKDPDFRK